MKNLDRLHSIPSCILRSNRAWMTLVFLLASALLAPATNAQNVPNSRPPKNDNEARFWLENMVWHHGMTDHEIRRATGWTFTQIEETKDRLNIRSENRPTEELDGPLKVLPYPGGRHPRIGFLEGAIEPQRETKLSVFLPWDSTSYVVADVPEAIWSNLGLTYLAHTHIDTVWDKEEIDLEPLEWKTERGWIYQCTRRLPNGIEFQSRVVSKGDHVEFTMSLKNETEEKLTDLRVQNCVMLKAAKGFAAQGNENKRLMGPYATCHDESGERWIITAWLPLHRCWANERCPCLHSDPIFPDCEPGETVTIQGWLSFHEGPDIEKEVKRIEASKWWE